MTNETRPLDESYRTSPDGCHFYNSGAYITHKRGWLPLLDVALLGDDTDAIALVQEVQEIRAGLVEAHRNITRARTGIIAADKADALDSTNAAFDGRVIEEGCRGRKAREQFQEADRAAALLLLKSQRIEPRLRELLDRAPKQIYAARQEKLDARRVEALERLADLTAEMQAIEAEERSLGEFGSVHVAGLYGPDDIIDVAPKDDRPRWHPPSGTPHGHVARDLLRAGRDPQRVPMHAADQIHAWLMDPPLTVRLDTVIHAENSDTPE